MRTIAFDGRTGASGDMILAALVGAGADPAVLEPVEAALGVRYEIGHVDRRGIHATTVHVRHDGQDDSHDHAHSHEEDHNHDSPDHAHSHDHDSPLSHERGHAHVHADDHNHAEGAGPRRTVEEVHAVLSRMDLPDPVADDARAVFELLAEAEAAIHGTDPDDTHFHEVGADDAIADVVGAALLLADLDVDRVVTTPIAVGGGAVEMHHGTYPVPAPAVLELAEAADWTLRGGPVDVELLTPTGAAILAHFAEGVDAIPPMDVAASGYGAGDRDLESRPNVLRALVGESSPGLVRDDVTVLETNVDDVAPEVLGDLQRSLVDAGARDVAVVPATMKKSRPGHLVKVVCRPADAGRLARRLAEETGTLGVREHGAGHRWIAHREVVTATVALDGEAYEVAVKIASDDQGTVFDLSAEYEDAAAVAGETGVPVREVLRLAEDVARQNWEA